MKTTTAFLHSESLIPELFWLTDSRDSGSFATELKFDNLQPNWMNSFLMISDSFSKEFSIKLW